MNRFRAIVLSLLISAVLISGSTESQAIAQGGNPPSTEGAIGTTITYQGRLDDAGQPANGIYDFRFILYNQAEGGNQVGAMVQQGDISLNQGYFTVLLNFGPVFDGQEVWLEVGVRPGDSSAEYTTLSPRQPLTATPFANYSLNAPWDGLTGVPAGFADGLDNDTTYSAGDGIILNGGQFSINFAGSGSATSAARSDHDHLGQTWAGTDNPLIIEGSFSGFADIATLSLSNTGTGKGLIVGSGGNGIEITSVGFGIQVSSSTSTGIVVNSNSTGVHVNPADFWGVYATSTSPNHAGGKFNNQAEGGAGLIAEGGSNFAPDLILSESEDGGDDGRINSAPGETGSDLILTSNDAFQIDLDNDNNENGDLWVLNGDNVTVFAVNESGDMTALGTKSAAVSTEDFGVVKLYALESPENWFEDFGTAQILTDTAKVVIEPVFAQTVNITEDYHVFLTPLGDCALYISEKTPEYFVVKPIGGQACSIAFDYRIVARRLGFEGLRLEPAAELQREGEE